MRTVSIRMCRHATTGHSSRSRRRTGSAIFVSGRRRLARHGHDNRVRLIERSTNEPRDRPGAIRHNALLALTYFQGVVSAPVKSRAPTRCQDFYATRFIEPRKMDRKTAPAVIDQSQAVLWKPKRKTKWKPVERRTVSTSACKLHFARTESNNRIRWPEREQEKKQKS